MEPTATMNMASNTRYRAVGAEIKITTAYKHFLFSVRSTFSERHDSDTHKINQ